jgi:nucleoside-diphosphate kinase
MPLEQTLSMIKPDGVQRGLIGNVIARFEKNGLKLRAMKMLHLSLDQARAFYAVHKERPFYDSLTNFMSSGPIVAMLLEGDNAIQVNRTLMGATDYRQADLGTIRADFARDIEANIVHGSDAPETAKVEIGFFFNALEQV